MAMAATTTARSKSPSTIRTPASSCRAATSMSAALVAERRPATFFRVGVFSGCAARIESRCPTLPSGQEPTPRQKALPTLDEAGLSSWFERVRTPQLSAGTAQGAGAVDDLCGGGVLGESAGVLHA